jgi:hypothetical protein
MRKPSPFSRRILSLGVAPVAVLAAGALVFSASNAAFSSTTRNAGNNWSAGSVALTDDDAGVAAFQVTNLTPGKSGEKCIVVTASSATPGVVKAYVQNLSVTGHGLEKRVKLQIQQGTGGTFNDCSGWTLDPTVPVLPAQSLEALSTLNHDYGTGGTPWITTGKAAGESKTYKGTWSFDTAGMTQQEVDALQGSSVSLDLVWELQNS